MLSQENLDRFKTEETPLSLVLFDEIEKASDALWKLLLGILDKGTLTLGDNRRVDFSRCVIVMTSNLGAREMSGLMSAGIGFAGAQRANSASDGDSNIDEKIYRTAVQAASRNFAPEFMNRIDKVVVFHSLNEQHLRQILIWSFPHYKNASCARQTQSLCFSAPLRLRRCCYGKELTTGMVHVT